jgi:hypothetical protein
MGRACDINISEEEYVQDLVGKRGRKSPLGKPRHR